MNKASINMSQIIFLFGDLIQLVNVNFFNFCVLLSWGLLP